MKKLVLLTKVVVLLLYTSIATADIIFEGYYKLIDNSKHVGYFIQRYELEPASKVFSSTYYLFTKTMDGVVVNESLNAKATSTLKPMSYQFSRSEGTKVTAIDAIIKTTGKNSKFVFKIVENGKPPRVREVTLNDKVFLSTFLAHLILQSPKGIKVGNKFTYEAIAEEDGEIERGEVYVKEQVKEKGIDTFRTLNTFKKDEFVNWLNVKGESIKTSVPKLNIEAELMANPKDAYSGMPFSETIIKALFGNIPEGKKNLLSTK